MTREEMYGVMLEVANQRRNMLTFARLGEESFVISDMDGIMFNGVEDREFYEGCEFQDFEVLEMYTRFMEEYGHTSASMRKSVDIIAGIVLDHGEKMVNGLRHVCFNFAGNHIDICQTRDGRLEVCEVDPSDFSYSHGDIHTYAPFEVDGFREKLEEKYKNA